MRTAFSEVTLGRVEELDQVRAFLVADERVLLVTGPGGIGKTHLLRDARAAATASGVTWLQGTGTWVPGVSDPAASYGPLREAVRGTELAAALDGPLPSAAQVEPQLSRQQLFAAALAARAPVVLAIDDLQWVDRSTLAMVLHLAHVAGPQVRLVVGSRPVAADEPAGALIEHLRRRDDVVHLELRALPDTAVAELVALSSDTADARIDEVVRLAQGNPLAAVELARHPGSRVPPTVVAAVRWRLATVAPDAARATFAAAVLGGDHSASVLADVLRRLGVEPVDGALTAAVDAGLIWRADDGYAFAHPLEREAVYVGLLPDERAALHAAVAGALSARPPSTDLLAAVAMHLHEAGDHRRAAVASLAAASAAADAGAYREALEHQARALAAARRVGDAEIDLDAETLRAAELARWAGDPEEGLRLLAERLATPGRAAALLWARVGWLRRDTGDVLGAGIAYDRAAGSLAGASDHERAEVMADLATWHMVQFRNAAALSACDDGLALLEPGPSSTRAHLLITRGVLVADSGQTEEGLRLLEEGRRVALVVGDEWAVWRYVGNVTYVLENNGRTAAAVDLALRAYERARAAHVEHSLVVLPTAVNAVVALTELVRLDEAEALAEHVLLGEPPDAWRALVLATQALARARRARPDEARGLLDAAREAAGDDADDQLRERIATAEAETALADGDPAAARSAVDGAVATAGQIEDEDHLARTLVLALRIEHGLGADPDRVVALGQLRPSWEFPAALHARVCELEVASSSSDVEWGAVADEADPVDPLLGAYARLRRAEQVLERKDRRAAAAILSAALRALPPAALDTVVAEQLRRLALLHHLTLDAAPGAGGPSAAAARGLTRREIEVLGMLVEGASNRQIARTLGMSEKTASVHVSRVITKLGVTSRLEASAKALREKLLST